MLLILMPCCSHRSRLIPALLCLSVATRALSSRWEPSQLLLFPLTLTQGCSQEFKIEVERKQAILFVIDNLLFIRLSVISIPNNLTLIIFVVFWGYFISDIVGSREKRRDEATE